MKAFYKLLSVALVVAAANNFVWFALTYWAYLTTRSVVSTSIVGGTFLVAAALSSFWLGSIVDNHKKKHAMLGSSIATLILFILGLVIYISNPITAFSSVASPTFWILVLVLLCGTIAGSIYNIAIPTLVTIMVPEGKHDRANGMFGTVMGVSFAITSLASGLVLGFLGMNWVLIIAIICTILAIGILLLIQVPEHEVVHSQSEAPKKIDIKGTIKAIRSIPGLFALIFFTTFNNFLGGVFMALMDAYGLTLVSVQVWGMLWGVLSFGFIIGGIYISKKGLGKSPLKNLFRINIVIWAVCIFFTIQPSIILLAIGALVWMIMMPFIEATEQTIIQKVVPVQRQGRVFGFAHSVEQAASPLTAFMIGPIAQYVFIPFMTTGRGVELIGDWFGVGEGRGIALVFTLAGIIGLAVTLIAMRSNSYKLLAQRYQE
jgi:MFS transporter, DHA3 family, multidrug efflux protein